MKGLFIIIALVVSLSGCQGTPVQYLRHQIAEAGYRCVAAAIAAKSTQQAEACAKQEQQALDKLK